MGKVTLGRAKCVTGWQWDRACLGLRHRDAHQRGSNAIVENLDGCICQISPLSITFLWLLLGQWVLQRREELIT